MSATAPAPEVTAAFIQRGRVRVEFKALAGLEYCVELERRGSMFRRSWSKLLLEGDGDGCGDGDVNVFHRAPIAFDVPQQRAPSAVRVRARVPGSEWGPPSNRTAVTSLTVETPGSGSGSSEAGSLSPVSDVSTVTSPLAPTGPTAPTPEITPYEPPVSQEQQQQQPHKTSKVPHAPVPTATPPAACPIADADTSDQLLARIAQLEEAREADNKKLEAIIRQQRDMFATLTGLETRAASSVAAATATKQLVSRMQKLQQGTAHSVTAMAKDLRGDLAEHKTQWSNRVEQLASEIKATSTKLDTYVQHEGQQSADDLRQLASEIKATSTKLGDLRQRVETVADTASAAPTKSAVKTLVTGVYERIDEFGKALASVTTDLEAIRDQRLVGVEKSVRELSEFTRGSASKTSGRMDNVENALEVCSRKVGAAEALPRDHATIRALQSEVAELRGQVARLETTVTDSNAQFEAALAVIRSLTRRKRGDSPSAAASASRVASVASVAPRSATGTRKPGAASATASSSDRGVKRTRPASATPTESVTHRGASVGKAAASSKAAGAGGAKRRRKAKATPSTTPPAPGPAPSLASATTRDATTADGDTIMTPPQTGNASTAAGAKAPKSTSKAGTKSGSKTSKSGSKTSKSGSKTRKAGTKTTKAGTKTTKAGTKTSESRSTTSKSGSKVGQAAASARTTKPRVPSPPASAGFGGGSSAGARSSATAATDTPSPSTASYTPSPPPQASARASTQSSAQTRREARTKTPSVPGISKRRRYELESDTDSSDSDSDDELPSVLRHATATTSKSTGAADGTTSAGPGESNSGLSVTENGKPALTVGVAPPKTRRASRARMGRTATTPANKASNADIIELSDGEEEDDDDVVLTHRRRIGNRDDKGNPEDSSDDDDDASNSDDDDSSDHDDDSDFDPEVDGFTHY